MFLTGGKRRCIVIHLTQTQVGYTQAETVLAEFLSYKHQPKVR